MELIFIENLKPYNLIKVEFHSIDNISNDDQLLNNILNTEIEYIASDPYHRYYIGIISLILLCANMTMIIKFFDKVHFFMIFDNLSLM